MSDFLNSYWNLIVVAGGYAALVVFLWRLRRRQRVNEAVREALPALDRNLQYLRQCEFRLREQVDRRPRDPKNLFLAEHLRRRAQQHMDTLHRMRRELDRG